MARVWCGAGLIHDCAGSIQTCTVYICISVQIRRRTALLFDSLRAPGVTGRGSSPRVTYVIPATRLSPCELGHGNRNV